MTWVTPRDAVPTVWTYGSRRCIVCHVSDDREIQHRISALIEEEHGLRSTAGSGSGPAAAQGDRLAKIEVELDQCWDLLRQRQARREFGADPDAAHVRAADVVEGYRG